MKTIVAWLIVVLTFIAGWGVTAWIALQTHVIICIPLGFLFGWWIVGFKHWIFEDILDVEN